MNINKIWSVYFSGTGTTKKIVETVADKICGDLNISKEILDFTLPAQRENAKAFGAGDLVVFGVPVYAGRVPNVLLNYIKTVTGTGAVAIPVVLYGNRNFDDALIELKTLLEENGFKTLSAAAFIGEHSFSKILGANRPDAEDIKTAIAFATKTAEKLATISTIEDIQPLTVKGEDPIRWYYQPRDRNGEAVDIRKDKPKTKDGCDNCGVCVAVCPMASINPENPSEITGICIKCGACIKKCHLGVKYYDSANYIYHKEELEQEYTRRAEPELFV